MIKRYDLHIKGTDLLEHIKERCAKAGGLVQGNS
jgi:hypothetical protein